jgi:hypothetical protein
MSKEKSDVIFDGFIYAKSFVEIDSTITVANGSFDKGIIFYDSTTAVVRGFGLRNNGDYGAPGTEPGLTVTNQLGAIAPLTGADPAYPQQFTTKKYVDQRIQSGLGATNAAGTATITFNPPYATTPSLVAMCYGTASFMISSGAPANTGSNYYLTAYNHAGAVAQTYFFWIATPATQ